jgi:heat shock protein HtpX
MIPSSWFRRLIITIFLAQTLGVLVWLASVLVPSPSDWAWAHTVVMLLALTGVYAGGPILARFLAPYPTRDDHSDRFGQPYRPLPGDQLLIAG